MNACVYPCDCPVHDQVAEMLGLVSTTGKDFRPASSKTAQDHALDARRHADESVRQAQIAAKAVKELRYSVGKELARSHTPAMPSCKECGSSRLREVNGRLNEPVEAFCGDCGHQGHVWMGQY